MAVVTVSRRANCNVDTYLYMVNTAIYRLCKQEVYFSYYHNHSLSGHSSSKNVFCEETMSYSKGTKRQEKGSKGSTYLLIVVISD